MDSTRAARLADQSWPDLNVQFRRSWGVPPPLEKRNPALAGTSNRANLVSSGIETNTAAADAAQRAITRALARAAHLDRLADLLLALGNPASAERLSHLATELREVAQ